MPQEERNQVKIKVLLIEDDETISELYLMRLEQEGYGVIQAVDGGQGLNMAKKELPDIIILDIILPKLDGFSVLKKLKGDEKTREIPVLILTNLGQEGDIQKGVDLGAVDYLVKSGLTPAQVLEKVEEYLPG